MTSKSDYIYRKATVSDVPVIHKIINAIAAKDEMLPRSLNQLYDSLRDFWVCEVNGAVRGCSALHVLWGDLGEIRSVAIEPEYQKKGIGRELVNRNIAEAKQLGLPRIFLLTYKPEFFQKFGFSVIDKHSLPQKVWTECVNCPKFPDCGETAMILNFN